VGSVHLERNIRKQILKRKEHQYSDDHLCGQVTGFRSRDPGLILGATRFSEE
jgi:hypothetical protein